MSNLVWHKFVTLRVYLCVPHDGHDAARCAGPSVRLLSVETCKGASSSV